MNSRWIIAFLITCVLAIPGGALENSGAQTPGDPEGANQTESYPEANSALNNSRDVVVIAPQACPPDIPQQIIDYLELTPKQIESIRAQLTEQCQQVQPLFKRLEKSRLKLIAVRLHGKDGDREVQALAAEQSRLIKQLIVANSQLVTKEIRQRVREGIDFAAAVAQ